MSQYALSLSLPAIFADENFTVSPSNSVAHQRVTSWPSWPAHGMYLYGPEGSGKSHLGHIWARQAAAQILRAQALDSAQIAYMDGNWLIEDIQHIADQKALFHLHNHLKEQGQYLLLTGNVAASLLPLDLPDLTSRIRALPAANITEADDHTVAAILRKQFADRQLKVDEELIAYLLPRIDRSYNKINELISSLDQQALAGHKKLTIPFVRQILTLPPL